MIGVRLQDERGRPECDSDIGIPFALPTGDASYKLLCHIDPYGDTVFNRLQMVVFLTEWERLIGIAQTSEQRKAWTGVRDLARRCNEEVHLYLRFIGD